VRSNRYESLVSLVHILIQPHCISRWCRVHFVCAQDPVELERAFLWITRRGYALTLVLIILWPALSAAVGVFSKGYFSFWVLISLAWGFAAAIVITVLPLTESKDELLNVFNGMWCAITGREHIPSSSEVARHHYEEDHLKEKLEEAPADESASSEVMVEGHDEEHLA
jgi:urea-proton symporter